MGPFLAISFLIFSSTFVLEKVLACTFVGLVRAKTTLMEAIIVFLTSPSCLSFLWIMKLVALEWSGLPVTSSLAHCPNSSSTWSPTINVLFMLLTCPVTWSDGFSIELFGVENNSTNAVLAVSKV